MKKKDIFHSWKEISHYLDRDIRTCLRWEIDLGLPIHRIDESSPRSKVFAFKSEIDQWLKERANNKEIEKSSLLVKKWTVIGMMSVFALLSITFAFLYFTQRKTFSPPFKILSIAVLPFENLNFQEHEKYIPEGITGEITNNLSRLNKINVISSSLLAKYNNISKNTNQIGRELGADYIVKGKIEKDDNKVNLSVQLIRAKDDKNIWREEFEDKLENIFSMEENICFKISEALNINMPKELPFSLNKGNTNNYLAFDNYLKANHILKSLNENNNDPWKLYHQGKYYWGLSTKEGNELAISLFSQAIEIDSNFALAYIGLAHCYINYINFNWDFNKKWLNQAEELLKKAQTISPDFPEYYSNLIKIYLIKEIGFNKNTKILAYKLAEKAIQKYPNDAHLNSITGYCYLRKFGEEGNEADFHKALEYKEKSFWLNPSGVNNIVYAKLLMFNKEFNKASFACNTIRKHTSSSMADFLLGEIYYYQGDLDKSKAIFQQLNMPLEFKIGSLFHLGMIASQQGDTDEVERIIQEINNIAPTESTIFEAYLKLASIYMGIGKKEEGYNYLESFFNKEIARKMQHFYHKYIDIDRNFDNLREEKEFQKIIKNKEGIDD